nr:unnamed protein product [Callosobruchus analis]
MASLVMVINSIAQQYHKLNACCVVRLIKKFLLSAASACRRASLGREVGWLDGTLLGPQVLLEPPGSDLLHILNGLSPDRATTYQLLDFRIKEEKRAEVG